MGTASRRGHTAAKGQKDGQRLAQGWAKPTGLCDMGRARIWFLSYWRHQLEGQQVSTAVPNLTDQHVHSLHQANLVSWRAAPSRRCCPRQASLAAEHISIMPVRLQPQHAPCEAHPRSTLFWWHLHLEFTKGEEHHRQIFVYLSPVT